MDTVGSGWNTEKITVASAVLPLSSVAVATTVWSPSPHSVAGE